MAKYFVIDEDNNTSWNTDDEKTESFGSEAEARRRAVELAKQEPGKSFLVCKAVGSVACTISDPVFATIT